NRLGIAPTMTAVSSIWSYQLNVFTGMLVNPAAGIVFNASWRTPAACRSNSAPSARPDQYATSARFSSRRRPSRGEPRAVAPMCVCAVISSSFVYSSCAVCDSRRARPALFRVGLLPRKPQTAMHSVHGTLAGLRTRGRHAFAYWTSLPRCGTQCVVRLSFPLTAAGQSRIHTGFPLTTTQHHTEPNQLHVQYNQENSFG